MSTAVSRDAIALVVARLTRDQQAAALITTDYRAQPAVLLVAVADLIVAAVSRTTEPRLDNDAILTWLGDLGLALARAAGVVSNGPTTSPCSRSSTSRRSSDVGADEYTRCSCVPFTGE